MNRMPSVMYGKDRIEYLHIIDGKILCGEDLVFKGESCKKCKHHAGITGTEPGRYVMCTRHRYRKLGTSYIQTDSTQDETSGDYAGDAHTVDEELRVGGGVLSMILDGITKGYNDFEIIVRARRKE